MIYLDYNATSPLDPRVLEAMMPYLRERFGNAASRHHRLGLEAAEAVEAARERAAAVLGAEAREIFWTSGATESNNLALQGVAASPAYARKDRHVVTVATEHRAVLDVADHLERQGFRVTCLPVDREGMLDLGRLADAVTDRTLLVSVMHANNETGVLHPLAQIGAICRQKGALFHTDATQSFGKEPIDVQASQIDLLSASAHKFCGPKGAGLLYVRRQDPRVRCEARIFGGGHERGLRSGTLNVPAIVGLGRAASLARELGPDEQGRFRRLRDRLESSLANALPGVQVNGHPERRLTQTSNLSFPEIDAEALIQALPDLAVSTSSACTSAQLQPSYVLGALGLDEERIRSSIRFSLGRFTTEAEIEQAAQAVAQAAVRLRKA